jgi:hypothetical protein
MNQKAAIGSAHADPVLDYMIRHNMDLTADVYLAYAYPDGVPEDVDVRSIVPAELLETASTAPTQAG